MEIKDLRIKILADLERCKSFNKVLDNGKEVVLIHLSSTYSIHLTKNQNNLYDACFSRHAPEFKTLFEPYKK